MNAYYILEHKSDTMFHRSGERQEIKTDKTVIGRGTQCQVRFDESFPTISRRHAVIERDGAQWKLVNITTNSATFVNGNRISAEWRLQSGDEIQIAPNGPKLRFFIPQYQPTTDLSRPAATPQQRRHGNSFRPVHFKQHTEHKRDKSIIWGAVIFGILFIVLLAALIYVLSKKRDSAKFNYEPVIENVIDWENEGYDDSYTEDYTDNEAVTDQPSIIPDETPAEETPPESEEGAAAAGNAGVTSFTDPAPVTLPENNWFQPPVQYVMPPSVDKLLAEIKNDIYFIVTHSYIYDKSLDKIEPVATTTGSGFLLSDGSFVTTRHCVENWLIDHNEQCVHANIKANTYPKNYNLYSQVMVYSKNGLQFTLKSSDFKINRRLDVLSETDIDELNKPIRKRNMLPISVECEAPESGLMFSQDWAVAKIARKSKLKADYVASCALRAGEDAHILGFPHTAGVAQCENMLEPIYDKESISRDGIDSYGCILTSKNADNCNSGSPVMALRNNRLVVVGILSRLNFASKQYNHIIPIKYAKL